METRVAVVGLGALLPDARNPEEFWQNILNKKVSIRPLPEELFETEVFYRPELLTALAKDDKSTTKIAGWIQNLQFDTVRRHKIPPSVAEHMDANQHAALYTAGQALEMNPLKEVPRERIAVIFGNGMVGTQYGDALVRVEFQLVQHYLNRHPAFQRLAPAEQTDLVEYLRANVLKGSISITEDSAPGILPNIIAGRIANVYDFHGPSYTVDAACASVLAAVNAGIKGLQLREFDAVVCGGADMPLKQLGFILFSALNALSPDGSFPFDKRANGFVMAQGAGAITLKRLDDAVRNGDTIYAVITGYGEASDGKGKYIAAPNAEWQARTIEKACRMAGYPVDTIEMIEAHGTATKVGDVVEVDGMKQAFRALGVSRSNYCGLGSAKSNIGHLKSAAGVAGLLKAVLALHHKVLPPTAGFEEINPKLGLDTSPFYILDQAREWAPAQTHPRRANVSSFGFGGADYHIALQEYREEDYRQPVFTGVTQEPASQPRVESPSLPSSSPPASLALFSAATRDDLATSVREFLNTFRQQQETSFGEAVALHNYRASAAAPVRLAVQVGAPDDLATKLDLLVRSSDKSQDELLKAKGIFVGQSTPRRAAETAIMFPGQASQYVNMLRGVSEAYDLMRTLYREADAAWLSKRGHTVTSLMFRPDGSDAAASEVLRATQNAHPTIFLSGFALYQLLAQMGLSAQFMIGHSLGEITALAAGEKIGFQDALTLVEQRGYAFHEAKLPDQGKMISLPMSAADAARIIAESGADVHVANINSPQQTIVAGASAQVDHLKQHLDQKKINGKLLFVSHAFHTPLMQSVAERFYERIRGLTFTSSNTRVMMNHASLSYPDDSELSTQMPALLRDQILRPVNFVASIEKLYNDGVRLFVEVGPGSILSSLAKETLAGRDVTVVTTNFKGADDVTTLQKALGMLFAEGIPVKLIAGRSAPALNTGRSEAREATLPLTATPLPNKEVVHHTNTTSSATTQVVYSGAAIGLPGSYKQAFREDNFDQLFEGRNLLERLTDDEKQRLVDLQITKLIKQESGPTFKLLSSLDDVIQLAGKMGRIDMIREYHIDEKVVQNMTSSIALGVAAGYEALKDARIPLVREYLRTSTGKLLPQKLALPAEMQEDTGVIFANGFPLIDPVIQEVSRHIAYTYGGKTRTELMAFYESLISRIKDYDAKKLLTDWYTLFYSRLSASPGQEEIYRFNHHFMTQISAQANNLLAFLLNARGPNFQLNAACSSSSNAITIAEDFLRSGRAKRMIVVGADDPTSSTNFPILGAGFLCTGAATNEGDLYKAAIPFDRRRNGMLVGTGAVGIIVETKAEVERRGVVEICELLGTHSFNTAKHISQIDAETFSLALQKFITRMEREHGIRREEIARRGVYISHETCTPPRGGCSQTEAESLRRTFADDFRKFIVGNTKGMTGHTMGASLEDAVAAKALQYGKCPPVVNFSEPDPMLEGLDLWKGGTHDRTYALKMSAGFGAQGHFALLRKSCSGDARILDRKRHLEWLKSIGARSEDDVELRERVLAIKDHATESAADRIPQKGTQTTSTTGVPGAPVSPAPAPAPVTATPAKGPDGESVIAQIARLTNYPPEMLEPDMEFDADLGIGPDRRTGIAAELEKVFNLPQQSLVISGDATIGKVVERITSRGGAGLASPPASMERQHIAPSNAPLPGKDVIASDVVRVFSEITKYPPDMLDLNMEMEADLGIDTVKQATILSILGEKYHLERQEGMQLSNYPTIQHIVDLVYQQVGAGVVASSPESPVEHEAVASSGVPAATGTPAGAEPSVLPSHDSDVKAAITAETLRIFSEVTKYPPDMLELDMEMEADLGIDTVKQATILSMLGEKYQLERQEGMQLSNYPTIRHIVDLIYEKGNAVSRDHPMQAASASQPTQDVADEPISLPVWETSLSRQVPHLVEEPLGAKEFELQGKRVWILGDKQGIAEEIAAAARGKGASTSTFLFPSSHAAEEVNARFADFAATGSADVIIDSTHCGTDHEGAWHLLSPVDAEARLFLSGDARFAVYKHLAAVKIRPVKIVCMTAIDGYVGVDGQKSHVVDPTYGATIGFYKALRKEWTGCDVRIVDFSPDALRQSLAQCIQHLFDEVEHAAAGVEIAYPADIRMIVRVDDKDLVSSDRIAFTEQDTFLITGGGTGIASRVLLELARTTPARFVVVDLIPLPENIESLASLDENGLAKVKQDLQDRLRSSGVKVTPALVNREYDKITKAIHTYRTLEEVRRSGRQVVYIACDVREREALAERLADARKTVGPITAIVHAAGVDHSHLIDQKSAEEFHAVFSVKAHGALALTSICKDDPLKLVMAFSSISGRFGNAAQLDYSAANHFLNDWTKMMHVAHPGAHAVSIAWSGWKDLGIAWRNEFVRARALELGLNFIEVDQGITAFMREITTRTTDHEVVIHNGLDGFLEPGLTSKYVGDLPLLDRTTTDRGEGERAYRLLSIERDAMLDQHRLGKVPIMPAVGYAELVVEYFVLQEGTKGQYTIRNMTFPNAFKLFREQPRELFVEGQKSSGDGSWSIEVKSTFKPPRGEAQTVLHSRATVMGGIPDLSGLDPEAWPYHKEQPTILPADQSLLLIKGEGPEQRIILGPLFDDVVRELKDKAPVLVYPAGTTYPSYFPHEQLANAKYPLAKMVINPCFLDSIYQACAAHLLLSKKRVYLPWEIGEIGIVRPPKEDGRYISHAQVVRDEGDVVSFNVVMVDGGGGICYYARDARFRLINL